VFLSFVGVFFFCSVDVEVYGCPKAGIPKDPALGAGQNALKHFLKRLNILALVPLAIYPDNELDHRAKLLTGPTRSGSFCCFDERLSVNTNAAIGELHWKQFEYLIRIHFITSPLAAW
jgi:hypothetical protein